MALLTLTQQQQFKPISANWANTAKINGGVTNFEQLQTEVEETDLAKWLGDAFLLDIQSNPTEQKYIDLLDGKTFKDCDGNNINFKGIRFQLAYMNFARYPDETAMKDTYSGMVRKQRDESRDAGVGDIKKQKNRAEEIATRDFEKMKIYLNDNTDTYTLWNCTTPKRFYKPTITTIRKTAN